MKLRMRNVLIISKIADSDVIKRTMELAEWLLAETSDWGHFNV